MMEMERKKRASALCALWKSTLQALMARQSVPDPEVNEEDYGTIWDSRSTLRDYEFGVPPCRFGDWQ